MNKLRRHLNLDKYIMASRSTLQSTLKFVNHLDKKPTQIYKDHIHMSLVAKCGNPECNKNVVYNLQFNNGRD